jgi:hypothetical protein
VLEVHNLNRLAHHRLPRDKAPSKGTLQEALAVVRGHRQVPRAEDRVLRRRDRVTLPNKTSPPQADSQVLVLRNLRPLVHHRLPRDRVPKKGPPQKALAVVRGHKQVHRAEVRAHKGRGRVVLPNRISLPQADKERAGKLANNPIRLEVKVANPRRH